jgi:hypothetical protein
MFEHSPHPPRAYQRRAAQAIVDRVLPDGAIVPAKVGWGKGMLTIAAFYELALRKQIDTVLIICPAYVRSVWADASPITGELAKYPNPRVPVQVVEHSATGSPLPRRANVLQVVVTNYELVRRPNRLDDLVCWLKGRKTLVVCDESWNLWTPSAMQTKAIGTIVAHADRAVFLTGSPGKPEQVYSQIQAINAKAYPVRNAFHWKARYATAGGYMGREIAGYRDDTAAERLAVENRYVIAPLDSDSVEMMPPSIITAQLTTRTWDIYRQMRDEFVAYLDATTSAVAPQAGVKFMRLQQILAGFVGGIEADGEDVLPTTGNSDIREVGTEKQDALLEWLHGQPTGRSIVWCRFRPEMERLATALRDIAPVHMLWGKPKETAAKQHEADRAVLKRLFSPASPDKSRRWIVGHPAAGGAGLDFSGADLSVYATNAQSLRVREQSIGRIHRPGQRSNARVVDIVAVGPKGQLTVDHALIKALRQEQDITEWTAAQWRAAVTGDDYASAPTWSTP